MFKHDITAAPFLMAFSQLPTAKKDTENGAAVTSLRTRTFIRSIAFRNPVLKSAEEELATDVRLLPNRINYSISLCKEDKCPYTLLCHWQFIMFFNRYQLLLLDSLTLWPCSSTSSLRRIAL